VETAVVETTALCRPAARVATAAGVAAGREAQ
jgi:hypothetical protein